MKLETLHSPHGIDLGYECPLCHETFPALFIFNKHVREKHPDGQQPQQAKKTETAR